MAMLWILLAFFGMGLCLAGSAAGRRRFLGAVAELLYLPIGTLLSLLRRCK